MQIIALSGTPRQVTKQLAMLADIEREFDAACAAAKPVWYLGAGAQYPTPLDAFLFLRLGNGAEDATADTVAKAKADLVQMMCQGVDLHELRDVALGLHQ